MTDDPPLLRTTCENGILRLKLNRPARLNALSNALLVKLGEAFASVGKDESVRCVVISGAGRAFCAGHDLAEMRSVPDKDKQLALFSLCSKVMQAIVDCPVPVIAQVHGIATAAGCQLAASCDLVIAAKSSRFAVSGINIGLFCSTPSVALTRAVGTKQAFDMLFTGDFIDAERAREIGLVSQIADDDGLEAAVSAKASIIASKDPVAIRYGKSLFHRQISLPLAEAYGLAASVMAENMMEPDTLERIDAFLQKREPRIN